MLNLRLPLSVAAAIAGLTLGLPSFGQLPASQGGGRALDANTQVGSGGNNAIQNQIDFAARNDLITGNVAGGFGFQGDIDYAAPGAFIGGLGSDDLFGFRAESLASSPNLTNLPGRGSIRGGNVVVFDDFTAIPPSRTINTNTRFAPTGGAFRVNRDFRENLPVELTLDRSSTTTFNDNRFNAAAGTNTLGVLRVQDGTALAVTADPLRGVRRRPLPSPEPTASPLLNDPSAADEDSRLEGFGTSPDNLVPVSPLNSNNTFTQGPADNAELIARNARLGFTDSTGLVKPSLELGQLAVNRANASNATVEQRVQQLQESIFGPAATPQEQETEAAEGEDAGNAYTRLLTEIREQAERSAAERLAEGGLNREGRTVRPEWMRSLEEPSEDEIAEAENTLEATMRRIRSLSSLTSESEDETAEGETEGESPSSAVDELLSDLSYSVRLETLVAEREGRVNALFAEAEQQLASGQFLNAKRTYRQIRIEAADNPLGLAGLIHAQLGAGMIRSAAFNLRSLFEQHPELIATRYGQNLLPPQDRLAWLQNEIQRGIDTENSSIDPGLMMAYLGHQIESRPLVRQGLAIAQNAAPLDPLLPVLRSIWLGQTPDTSLDSTK
ncbi:MAG: hypothetical protein AAGH99_03155 [Planctomycetota bacterium]